MGTFVTGNTPLPALKTDAYPTTGLSTELDAADINSLWSAAGDLRTAAFGVRQVFNVRASPFSAVGNGVADDTVAFQAAITAAQNASGTLYVPKGIYKITTGLTPTGINILGDGGASFSSTPTCELDFYGTGPCLTFTSSNNGGGERLEGIACISKAASQTGMLVFGSFGVFRNLAFKEFDTAGVQFGTASGVGAYYSSVSNIAIVNQVTQGVVGLLVVGGFPATNDNRFEQTVVSGRFTHMVQLDGSKNLFLQGDVDPDTRGTGVSSVFFVSGTCNEIRSCYTELAGGVNPANIVTFTNTTNSNWISDLQVQYAVSSVLPNQSIAYVDQGWNNRIDVRAVGFNFLNTATNSSDQNLVVNSGFQQWDTVAVAPYGWVNIGGVGTAAQDTTVTHGTATSLKLTGAAQNVLWGTFFVSPTAGDKSLNQYPIAYFRGKQVTVSVWCKSSFALQGNVRVNCDGTSGGTIASGGIGQTLHSGSGNWELLTASNMIPLDATKVGIHVRNTNGGATLTGDIWFSEPTAVVGSYGGHYAAHPLTDTTAQLMGPIIEAPPLALTYGPAIATDASQNNSFLITATNGVAFTISSPTNLKPGQRVLYTIANTSGGALGAVTLGALFKSPALVLPATGNNRSYEFQYNGTNLRFLYQSAADVPN